MNKLMKAEKRISNLTGRKDSCWETVREKARSLLLKRPWNRASRLFLSLLLFSCFWVKAGTMERFSSSECLDHCSALENCFDSVRKDRLGEKINVGNIWLSQWCISQLIAFFSFGKFSSGITSNIASSKLSLSSPFEAKNSFTLHLFKLPIHLLHCVISFRFHLLFLSLLHSTYSTALSSISWFFFVFS